MGVHLGQGEAIASAHQAYEPALGAALPLEIIGSEPLLRDFRSRPEFRVVAQGKRKRGIRLEHVFWQAAKRIAEQRRTTIGGFFDAVSDSDANASNLASAIRVACLSWMADRTAELEAITSVSVLNSILAAVPTPAVVLGLDRRIVTSNKAFHSFARRHFGVPANTDLTHIKLSPDLAVPDIIAKLEFDGANSVTTGFGLILGDRRIRGQLNAVRAPLSEPGNIIGFVVL